MSGWDDDRLEAALAGLRDTLDVGVDVDLDRSVPAGAIEAQPGATPSGRRRRLLVAAVALAVGTAGALVAVPEARQAVARWFGVGTVDVERRPDAPEPAGLGAFVTGVEPLPLQAALAELRPAGDRLDAAGLGAPSSSGRPPEGGVVVAWDDGTTLWALPLSEAPLLDKQLGVDDDAEMLDGIGTDVAVLVDGPHVLVTPVRAVAADRLVWWIDGDVQYRLEADRPRATLITIVDELAGAS